VPTSPGLGHEIDLEQITANTLRRYDSAQTS